MKRKTITVLSLFVLLFCVVTHVAGAAEGSHDKLMRQFREREAKAKKAVEPQSIWDDKSEANPYFKKQNSGKTKKVADKKEKKVREPKRTTFKRRVYTGPSKEEIVAAAKKDAVENFNALLESENYDLKYDKITYNVPADSLSVSKIVFIPVQKDEKEKEKPLIPYIMKADELVLRNLNIGEKNGTPLLRDGEMTVKNMEIPVWNENGVKKGKVDIEYLKMTGDLPPFLHAKGNGKLKLMEIKKLRSETIINETVLNNVVRSKIFSASDAAFYDVVMQSAIIDALKKQEVSGFKFSSAQIDGQTVPSLESAAAAMTSYSARILDTDLVLGARLEAQKGDPAADPDLEQLKKNVEENKAALVKVTAETLK